MLFDLKSILAVSAILLCIAMAALAKEDAKAQKTGDDAKQAKLTCVTWKSEARFVGFAFNHLVHLKNGCDHPVSCTVKTDVNPKAETVTLSKGDKKSHLTFRGSPTRKFKAKVDCRK